ncbi:MAG: nucleotidyltransferase family protein [Nanoarchaeota archaeon]|nr:nucleotidyltransferase family protein [Nanoarchaeota archaeon]MBU1027849.1 nucleotidyltransferase family protein [Nanoarchaeota archaeon]
MTYTEVRNIKGKKYYYRVISIRKDKKISKKRVYLGHDLSNFDILEKEKIADTKLLFNKIKKPNKEIEKIKSKIVPVLRKNKVTKAGIFGSYSRGEQRKDSDVDIVVNIEDKKMSLLGFIGLMRLLEEILKRKVDLVEYKAIKPRIKERILKEEIRII